MVLGFETGNRVLFLQSMRNGDEGDMKMKRGDNKGETKNDCCNLDCCPCQHGKPSLQLRWQEKWPDQHS